MSHEPDAVLSALFPDLREWDNGEGITVSDQLSMTGSIPQAIVYSTLFWPEFVEFDGFLLWSDADPTNVDDWMRSLEGNRTRVESVVNHRHLHDLFYPGTEYTDEQIDYLGQLLQHIWSLKLRSEFPHLNVQVEFYWPDRQASDTAQITVYCLRPG